MASPVAGYHIWMVYDLVASDVSIRRVPTVYEPCFSTERSDPNVRLSAEEMDFVKTQLDSIEPHIQAKPKDLGCG